MKTYLGTPLFLRLIIAVIVATVVTGVCLNLTYDGAGTFVRYQQIFTTRRIDEADKDIKAFIKKSGAPPRSLRELQSPSNEADFNYLDTWGQPLDYQLQGRSYTLVSYGRDGKPGGVGLDADLSNLNPRPPAAELPFQHVIFHPLAEGMLWMSLFSGALVFVLTFATVKPQSLSREGALGLLAQLVVTLIGTVFAAGFITVMHVPSGH
jgi:general secretion pathway protein G